MAVAIYYDRDVRRFRYSNGAFASREAVIYQSRVYLRETQKEFIELGQRLKSDPRNQDIQELMIEKLKAIHITNGLIAAGGSDRLFANDYLTIGRILRSQYGQSENNPSPYGLRFLFDEITAGSVSDKRLSQRLEMYAKSGKTSFFAVEKNKKELEGATRAKRVLNAKDKSCNECRSYSSLNFVPISELVLPTVGCSCKSNCKCTVIYQ